MKTKLSKIDKDKLYITIKNNRLVLVKTEEKEQENIIYDIDKHEVIK